MAALDGAGDLFATAYIASQEEVIAQYGIEVTEVPFGAYKTFQTSVVEIEAAHRPEILVRRRREEGVERVRSVERTAVNAPASASPRDGCAGEHDSDGAAGELLRDHGPRRHSTVAVRLAAAD